MSPISAASVRPSSSATPGIVISSLTRASARASGRSSRSSGASWRVEVVDNAEQRGDRLPPDLRDAVLGELVDRAGLAQRGEVAPQPPLRQQPERAVDRRGPQPDQVRATSQPFAVGALVERRHPHLGDQVAASKVGQHARVDAIGLARQRRDRLDLAGVGERIVPAAPSRAGRGPRRRRSSSRCSREPRRRRALATSRDRPSWSAGIAPSRSAPCSSSAHQLARRVPQSMPRYCMKSSSRQQAVEPNSAESAARGGPNRRRRPARLHDSRWPRSRASRPGGSASASSGKMPTTSVRRPISRLKRSSGLVERSLRPVLGRERVEGEHVRARRPRAAPRSSAAGVELRRPRRAGAGAPARRRRR